MDLEKLAEEIARDAERWYPGSHADLAALVLKISADTGYLSNITARIATGDTMLQNELGQLRQAVMDLLIHTVQVGQLLRVPWQHEYITIRNSHQFTYERKMKDAQAFESIVGTEVDPGSGGPLRSVADPDRADEPEEEG